MEIVNDRVKAMRFTSAAVGLSFLTMLFILISMGVPWYEPNDSDFNIQLFFAVKRNSSWAKDAGDPTFAFVFMAVLAFIVAIYGTYLRWAGRDAKLPSTWQHVAGYYGVTAFLLFLSFCIYAGKVNGTSETKKGSGGNFGGGFALAIILWLTLSAEAAVIWWKRDEVDAAKPPAAGAAGAAGADPMTYSNPVTAGANAAPLADPSPRWRKLKVHSALLGLDLFLILLLLIAMGAPWWSVEVGGTTFHYGLIEEHFRHVKDTAYRDAGDATFPFLLFALLAQLYAVVAVTLRFLGRTDAFTGRIPHSLMACLISTGVSSFCVFLSFCIYAGTVNDKLESNVSGHFGGGLALSILNWLFTMAVLVILHFKKDEVDNAPAATPAGGSTETMYPPPAPQSFGAPPTSTMNPYGDQAANPVPYNEPAPTPGYGDAPAPVPNPDYGPAGDDDMPKV